MSRLNSSSFLLAEMDGFEPSKWQSQSLLPSLLATSQYLVLKAGLEPARSYEQLILSQSCLPFHHSSMNGCTKPTTSFSLLLVNNGCRSGTWTSRPLGYGPSTLPLRHPAELLFHNHNSFKYYINLRLLMLFILIKLLSIRINHLILFILNIITIKLIPLLKVYPRTKYWKDHYKIQERICKLLCNQVGNWSQLF